MRSCLSWKPTDSVELRKSSEANDNGSLWVSGGAAKRDAIATIVQMVKYHALCVMSRPPGAFRDHLHLRTLWFCQLQFAWDCHWRPVWVFDHGFTIWCYCFLADEWPKCFLSHKASICPPRRSDISSMVLRAMITGTCVSLVNACIAGKRFFNIPGLHASLHFPKNLSEITLSWNAKLVFNWTCSPRDPVSSSSWLCGFVLRIELQHHKFWCDDMLCKPFPKVSERLISCVGMISHRYQRPNDSEMTFSCSTVRNRTITFEGSWSNVTNVASYFWSCCDCCASPTVDVCL